MTKCSVDKSKEKLTEKAKTDNKPMVYNVDVKSNNDSHKSDKMAKNNILNAGKPTQPSADECTLPYSHRQWMCYGLNQYLASWLVKCKCWH